MNLDSDKDFARLDRSGMLAEIQNLPDQLQQAWRTAQALPLPDGQQFAHIIVAGMGGSAIGADILAGYIAPFCQVPFTVLRGYQLPAWVAGKNDLVICSSHSGNTEETLSVFQECLEKRCTLMTISTGGRLLEEAREKGVVSWTFEHAGQPRAAVGFSFGMLLNLFSRLGLIPDQAQALQQAVAAMRQFMSQIDAQVPVEENLAKRIAGQSLGRFPLIFGAEHLEAVARRWKTQMNEIGKALAQFEFLPEADHNTLAGLVNPEELLTKTYALFLTSTRYHPRNQKRFDFTAKEFKLAGAVVDKIACQTDTSLAEIWSGILLGDFISFYQAMAYEVDPTPVDVLEDLKRALRA